MVTLGHPWLEGLETPFLWRPSELLDSRGKTSLLLVLQDRDREWRLFENRDLTFNNFVVSLLLAYEFVATRGDDAAAFDKLDQLEMDLFRMDIVSNCSFYQLVRRAQWHTLLASRAVLLAAVGRPHHSNQVVAENFDPISVFNSLEKAAICGIKSRAYLECGPAARYEALRLAKEAVAMNPVEAEWHFLVGIALEHIREDSGNFTGVSTEEIYHLERAVVLGGRGNHMVHLANVYDRLARQARQGLACNVRDESIELLVKNLTRNSFVLLRNALKGAENNTEIRLGCLKGLLKQPHRNLIKEELKKVLEESLSEHKKIRMFFSVAGKYYLKLEKDEQKAVQYFCEGNDQGDYSCSLNLIAVRYRLGQVMNLEQALRQLVDRYSNYTEYYEDALCHLGAWQMMEKHDITAALQTFTTVLEINPNCKSLLVYRQMIVRYDSPVDYHRVLYDQVHRPLFVRYDSPVNLLRVLYDHVNRTPVGYLPSYQQNLIIKSFKARYKTPQEL